MKLNPLIIIKTILLLFITVGLGLTLFMIIQEVKIIGAYFVSVAFILVPGIIWYGITYGFTVSERALKKRMQRQESVSFDKDGIAYTLPLSGTRLLISWATIETVIYTNHPSDENTRFVFLLTQPPMQVKTEDKPLWINTLSPFLHANKVVVKDDCRNFQEIPEMLEKYLGNINLIDLSKDPRKGTLISSKTTIKNNIIETEEHWRVNNNYETEKVIYDRHNRAFEQVMNIKKYNVNSSTQSANPLVIALYSFITQNENSDSDFWTQGGGFDDIYYRLLKFEEEDWNSLKDDLENWSYDQLELFCEGLLNVEYYRTHYSEKEIGNIENRFTVIPVLLAMEAAIGVINGNIEEFLKVYFPVVDAKSIKISNSITNLKKWNDNYTGWVNLKTGANVKSPFTETIDIAYNKVYG